MTSACVRPAAIARAITSSRSLTNSGPAMWQWLSTKSMMKGRPEGRPLPSLDSQLTDAGAGRHRRIHRYQRWRATLRAGRQHHSVRLDPHQLRRLQVRDDDDRPADELIGLIRLGDAGNDRPLLGPDIDTQLDQLLRLRNGLGFEHLRDRK